MKFKMNGQEYEALDEMHVSDLQDEYRRLCQYFQRSWRDNGRKVEVRVDINVGENGLPSFGLTGLVDGQPPMGWGIYSWYANSEKYQTIKADLDRWCSWADARERESA